MNATSAKATTAATLAQVSGGDTRHRRLVGGLGMKGPGSGVPLRRSTLPACQVPGNRASPPLPQGAARAAGTPGPDRANRARAGCGRDAPQERLWLFGTGDAGRGDRVGAVLALHADGLSGLEIAERAGDGDRGRAGRLHRDDRAVGLDDVDGRPVDELDRAGDAAAAGRAAGAGVAAAVAEAGESARQRGREVAPRGRPGR